MKELETECDELMKQNSRVLEKEKFIESEKAALIS